VVPSSEFLSRLQSDRYAAGTPPTLIRNATIWTGRFDGHEVVSGDVLLDKGIINEVGEVKQSVIDSYRNLVVIDAKGAWVTPG
jgi:imidazolonepropionase-like amidohydrolase